VMRMQRSRPTMRSALASAARDASALPVAGGCYAIAWETDGRIGVAFVDAVDWHAVGGMAVAKDGVIVTETIAHMEEVA
jgi:hypothetical protein